MQLRASVVVACALFASAAFAQGDRDRARAAYEEGTKAFRSGDFATAATRYAEADTLAPSPVALQAALDAAVKSDDAVLGAELLERARTRDVKGALATSVQTATTKLAHRAGKVTATCPSACSVTIDGTAVATGRARWLKLGAHAVVFSIDGRTETKSVDVAADAEISVEPPPPPAPPPMTVTVTPPPPAIVSVQPTPPPAFDEPRAHASHRRGLPPFVFWISLGAATAFTATTVTLYAVTQSTHDQFVSQTCATSVSASCRSLSSQGDTTMTAGNAFLGVAIASAVWTVIAGASLVKWHADIDIAPQPHGAALFWRMTF